MAIRTNPTPINRPQSYQAFRPGQWSTMKSGGTTNIFIQKNYYGDMGYRGWGNGWAMQAAEPEESWLDKVGKWIGIGSLGVGVVGAGVELIKSIFGKKKKEGNGEPEKTKAQDPQSKNQPTTPKEQPEKAAEQPATTPQDQPAAKPTASQEVKPSYTGDDADKINAGDDVADNTGVKWDNANGNVTDTAGKQSGKTRNIFGTVKAEKGAEGKLPKSFTVSDSTGTFTFKLIGTTKDGNKPVYQCTSGPNGAKYTKGNNYILDGSSNGNVNLSQPKEFSGSGISLRASNS